jgi:hypothetical protein
MSIAQVTSASARPVSPSTGRPTSLAIRENILEMKRADIERQIEEAARCIQDASNPTILRDPEGNINRVPQTDLVNCSRRLAQLQRQLQAVAREANQLAVNAEFEGAQIQRRLQRERSRLTIEQLRTRGSTGASP